MFCERHTDWFATGESKYSLLVDGNREDESAALVAASLSLLKVAKTFSLLKKVVLPHDTILFFKNAFTKDEAVKIWIFRVSDTPAKGNFYLLSGCQKPTEE